MANKQTTISLAQQVINTRNTKVADKAKANYWLNIGYTTEDAEGNEVFISLPMGLALDTMQVSKSNPYPEASIDLLNQILELGEQLDSGESLSIPSNNLVLKLQRVNDSTSKSDVKIKSVF